MQTHAIASGSALSTPRRYQPEDSQAAFSMRSVSGGVWPVSLASRLSSGEDLADNFPVHVREAELAALEAVGELLVVEP